MKQLQVLWLNMIIKVLPISLITLSLRMAIGLITPIMQQVKLQKFMLIMVCWQVIPITNITIMITTMMETVI